MSFDEAQQDKEKLAADKRRETEAIQAVFREHPSAEVEFEDVQESTKPRALMALVKWHPGMLFFQFLADSFYPRTTQPDKRFNAMYERFKCLFWIFLALDVLVMVTVLLFIALLLIRIIFPGLLPCLSSPLGWCGTS